MNRLFSIRRRRPHIIDIDTPKVYGVDGYRLKWAQNFDGVFAAILTSTNVGFLDDNVNRNVIETQPVTDKVRIVFDPTTYSISDVKSFWLKFFPVTGGVEGTPGAATLVLPDAAHHGVGDVAIAGTAPNGTALQLDLPLVQDIRFTNLDAAKSLLVGIEDGGPTTTILPKVGEQSLGIYGTQGTLYVTGSGATVDFSATFTLAFPR
jgi:hypothetical protein